MNLTQLRHIIAIAERGSLRAAARHSGFAQPALSRSVQGLERELGAKLFERSRTGAILTPIGEVVLQRAKSIQLDVQHTLDTIAQLKGEDSGTVAIGLSTAAHIALLPKVITPFRKRYPKVKLNVKEGLFPLLEAELRSGEIDLYVGPVPKDLNDGALLTKPLFDNRRIVVGRKGHPFAAATSVKDLAGAAWVTTPVLPDTENEVTAIYSSAGLEPPNIVAEASSGLSILMMVASSDLLAPLPVQWLDFIAATELIERIPIQEVPLAPAIGTVRRTRLPLTPAAEHLHDLILRAASHHAEDIARKYHP